MQAARRALQLVKKSLAEFGGVSRQIKSKIIFCRGVYLTENTSQAAECRICVPQARKLCAQQTAKNLSEKPVRDFSTV